MALRISPRSPFEECQVGQILVLKADDAHPALSSPSSPIFVRIRQLHSHTLSCNMVFDILDKEGSVLLDSSPAFLKLFDRRFAIQHRQDNGVELWTREVEVEYLDALKTDTIPQFLDDLHNIENFQDDTEEDWDKTQVEAFLIDELFPLYETETKVYRTLQEYQGRLIPKLLAAVTLELELDPINLDVTSEDKDRPPEALELLHIKGILLQYIQGFDLWSMPDHAPRTSWQNIIDQAVAVVRVVGDNYILNRDVRPESFRERL